MIGTDDEAQEVKKVINYFLEKQPLGSYVDIDSICFDANIEILAKFFPLKTKIAHQIRTGNCK